MRFKGFDLNLLVTLDALLTEGSVTAAAERLHITQSAASCALARLRDALGDEILVQSGKKMVRTPYGEEITPELRDILMRIDAATRSGPRFSPATSSRRFRIAASDYVAEVLLVAAIAEARNLAPAIRVELLPVVTDEVFAGLRHGNVDLMIAPQEYCHPDSPRQELLKDVFTCLAWSGNEAVGKQVTQEQFLDADHLLLKPYGHNQTLDEMFFRQRGIERKVAVTTSTFAMLPRLLVGSPWIASVPSKFAEFYKRVLPLKIVDTEFTMPMFTETMQWHASRQNDKGLAWLREQITSVVTTRSFA